MIAIMATFKFNLISFSNKCRNSFLNNTSNKSNALWAPTSDVINCTCGRIISKKHLNNHLLRDVHKKYATTNPIINNNNKTPISDLIIYINYEKLIKCRTCNAYINQFKFKSHSIPKCIFINKLNYKNKIECLCGGIFKDNVKYRSHLSLESHIIGHNKYMEDFDPWA